MAFSWTVSGHLGNFTQGQRLTTQAEVGSYMRMMLSEGKDEDVLAAELPDETIWTKLSEKWPDGGPNSPENNYEAASDADIEADGLLAKLIGNKNALTAA